MGIFIKNGSVGDTFCISLRKIIVDDYMYKGIESFVVAIKGIYPPVDFDTFGAVKVIIKDDDFRSVRKLVGNYLNYYEDYYTYYHRRSDLSHIKKGGYYYQTHHRH